MASVPKFKNVGVKPQQSPKDIKNKMRQNYKIKVQNCRSMLMDKLRGSLPEIDLRNTLTNIYKSMYNVTNETINDEEFEAIDEFENELVQEELEWWVKEYEQCQMLHVDWSSIEDNSDVICPICQKTNFQLNNGTLSCSHCNITIQTTKSLSEIKGLIKNLLDTHNTVCNSDVQFGLVSEVNECHVYLFCDNCMEMKLVI